MFATVATTVMVETPRARGRGRSVSLLLMSETSGLLLGSAAGGWLYQALGAASPFVVEAACMLLAAGAAWGWASPAAQRPAVGRDGPGERPLRAVLQRPHVILMGLTGAALIAVQTGVLVFLFPLHLVQRGSVGAEAVGLVVSLGVLGRLLALGLGGSASDRWGRLRVLVPGLLVYAALLASVSALAHPAALALGSLALGAAAGFVAPLPTALVGDSVPPSLRGVAIGWLRTTTDGGQILGPLALGALADAVDLAAPFLAGAALLAALAWACHGARRPCSEPGPRCTKEVR
jgi:MFS family permease